jgi:hypothetical protein
VIESLVVSEPSVHLVQTARGMAGAKGVGNAAAPESSGAAPRLSEVLRLQHFVLHGGQITFEDRTKMQAVPLVWKNLNIDLSANRLSDSAYFYRLAVDNAPLSKLDASGSADLDSLVLKVEEAALSVQVDPEAPSSALSPELQALLRRWQTRGTVAIHYSGTVPLRDPNSGQGQATLELQQASARIPQWGTPVDRVALKIEVAQGEAGKESAGQATIRIDRLEADAGDGQLRIKDVLAEVDWTKNVWKVTGLEGHLDPGHLRSALPQAIRDVLQQYSAQGALDFTASAAGPLQHADLRQITGQVNFRPVGLSLVPPGFDRPVSVVDNDNALAIQVKDGVAKLQSLLCKSGDNEFLAKEASIILADLPNHIRIDNIHGAVTLGPQQDYPPAIAQLLASCKPEGPFYFHGSMDLDPHRPASQAKYDFQVDTSHGRFTLSQWNIPITNVDMVVKVTPGVGEISHFDASALGGGVNVSGKMEWSDRPAYKIAVAFKGINLNELGQRLSKPGEAPPPLSGKAILRIQLAGTIPPADHPIYEDIGGQGEFEIRGGDFWRIPLMKRIADSVMIRQAITVGDAAGQFHIGQGKIHFDRALATSPVLGVEGPGDLSFDGQLDFKLVADVGGDWGSHVGNLGNGMVADVLNKAEKSVENAARQALYEVDVTGPATDPKANAIAAPFLTREVGKLLNGAKESQGKGGLLDMFHKQDAAAAPPP